MGTEKINLSKLSKVDELSSRKIFLEKAMEENKKQLEDKTMLLLGKALDENVEVKIEGQIVFFERWIKDIDKEIENL